MTDRLRILAILLPWVMRHPEGVAVDQVCSDFGLDPEELEALLDDGLMIGIAPFSPLEYLDCQIVDGVVHVVPFPGLDTPPRPSVTEALRALQAADAVLKLDGFEQAEALKGARAALAQFLEASGQPTDALQADLRLPGSDLVPTLRDAAAGGAQLTISHQKPGSDETERIVDPYGVFVENRAWYLDAFDHRANDRRTFRLDRIRAAVPNGTTFPPQQMRTSLRIEPSANAHKICLRIKPSAAWLIDTIDTDRSVALDDSSIDVYFRTDSLRWVVPLVLSGGEGVEIIDSPELADAVRRACEATLSNY